MRSYLIIFLSVIVISLVGIAAKFNLFFPITGMITGTASVTVSTSTTISLPISSVSFGSMNPGQYNNTTSNNPPPFVIQNDGNVNVNVTIGASDLWTAQANPSSYYQFNSTENETGSTVSAATDLVTWANMPATGSPAKVVTRLKYASADDAVNVHINITVPSDEGAGSKSSTVTFTASQA